jgi:hypothetical protein
MATSPRTNFECHACTPALSLFIYRQEKAMAWRLKWSAFEAFKGGQGWDSPPDEKEMALVHVTSDRCALAIRTGYASMGWDSSYYILIAVGADGARTLFSTTMSENNRGVGDKNKTNWESTIHIRPAKGTHYEILLHRQGILGNAPIDYDIRYAYDGSAYKAQKNDQVLHH